MSARARLLNATIRLLWKPQRLTVHETRHKLQRFAAFAPNWPSFVSVEPVDAGGVPAHWIEVPQTRAHRVLLYAHGGSYVSGSTHTHRMLIWRLACAARCRVLSVDYRLAPEFPYPLGRDDVLAAYRWTRAREPEASVALAGDSAGGGLVLSALHALDPGERAPEALVAFSPWADLAFSGASWRANERRDPWLSREYLSLAAHDYRGHTKADEPNLSTIHARFSHPVPSLLQVSDNEVLLDDSRQVARRLRESGAEVRLQIWHGLPHVWQMFAGALPEAKPAIAEVGRFLEAHWGRS